MNRSLFTPQGARAKNLIALFMCIVSVLTVTVVLGGCDSDGIASKKSPIYIVRPSQEVTFPILVVGRPIVKELEIENVGEGDLIISRSLIQTNLSQSGEYKIEYRLTGSETFEEIVFTEGPEASIVELIKLIEHM